MINATTQALDQTCEEKQKLKQDIGEDEPARLKLRQVLGTRKQTLGTLQVELQALQLESEAFWSFRSRSTSQHGLFRKGQYRCPTPS